MQWSSEIPVFAAAGLVLVVPGLVAALLVGLRGFPALTAAAPLSLAAIGAASLVNIVVPFRWGIPAWAITAVLLIGAAAALRRVMADPDRERVPVRSWQSWTPFAAAALGAVLIAPRLMFAFWGPEHISQTFDAIYHLNAVRFIIDTGALAPTRQLIPGFYPSLWHALTATVALVSGASVPVAINVVSVVLGAVVWPIGCVALVHRIVGHRPAALLAAGGLSATSGAFPLLMLDFGVLYPNVLSLALLPIVLAALVDVTGLGEGRRPGAVLRWLLLLAYVPTLALAHPSTLMAFLILGFWPAGWAGLRWFRTAAARGVPRARITAARWVWGGGIATALLLLLVARPSPREAFWGPYTTVPRAAADVLLNAQLSRAVDIPLTVLMLAGIVAIVGWQRRRLWLVLGWTSLAFIYVVSAALPKDWFRYGITGTWYSDLFRITALFPTVVVPLGALGFAALVGVAAAPLRRSPKAAAATRAVTGVAAGALVIALTQTGAPLAVATASARTSYAIGPYAPLLTSFERALIDRLPEHVAPDEVIAGSPWTGTSLSYALADRKALVPHIYDDLNGDLNPDTQTILHRLNRALTDPAVCAAVRRTHARWVLDFGDQEVHGGSHIYPGLTGLVQAGVAVLVDSDGPIAKLYRITACD